MPRTYTLTAASVIASARALLADMGLAVAPRSTDADLIAALNEAIAQMVSLVPGLFGVQAQHTCDAGYLQELQATRAALFMDVIGLPESDPATMNQFQPGWQNEATGTPETYMRVPGDSLRFMVYPPATAGSVMRIRFAQQPAALTQASDIVPVPEAYAPALADYVASRISTADDEHMNSGRAAALIQSFGATVKALGGGA